MAGNVQELVDMLYQMIQEAWGLPLGAEKCVIERDRALELLDEIKEQFPTELAEAKRLVAARAEFIANAKREAESIRKVAEDRARQLVDEQEIVRAAKNRSNELITNAESKSAELRRVANAYVDDAMKRTEDAISEALNEVRQSRIKFRSAAGSSGQRAADTADLGGDE
jgi:cell division septum initiation protein DivIVA